MESAGDILKSVCIYFLGETVSSFPREGVEGASGSAVDPSGFITGSF